MTMLEPSQTQAIRGMLLDAVNTPSPRRTHRVAISVAVGGAVAATLIVAGLIAPGDNSSAQAAEALKSAAMGTVSTSDVLVGAGQYLKVTTQASYLNYEQDANSNYSAYLSPSTTEVFVPGDAGADWVQRITAHPASAFFGAESKRAAERDWNDTLADGVVKISTAPDGTFADAQELGGERERGTLPSSPSAALKYLRAYGAAGSDVDVLNNAAELLRNGTMKAQERATIYEALALLPSIRITDDQAVLDGRRGMAFGLKDGGLPGAIDIVIDPVNGRFIGERTITPEAEGSIPAGTVSSFTAVTTSVVNAAPSIP